MKDITPKHKPVQGTAVFDRGGDFIFFLFEWNLHNCMNYIRNTECKLHYG